MKIFDWIRKYFERIRSRFRKKNPEQVLRDRTKNTKGTSHDAIRNHIEKRVQQEISITTEEISELAGNQTVAELQELVGIATKNRIRVFDLVEIEQEITTLNKKLIEIQIKQNQIGPIHFLQTYKIDDDIKELGHILQKFDNKQNLKLLTSVIDNIKNRFGQFDKFLQEQILVKRYRIREADRVKEFKKFKSEIEALYIQVSRQIEQSDFQSAKVSIRKLETLLKSIQALSVKVIQGKLKENKRIVSNLVNKTADLKSRLSFRETEIEANRQADELRKQQEEAKRQRLAEEAKREEDRLRQEQVTIIRQQADEAKKKKEEDNKQALQRLLVKKPDWRDFSRVLQDNGITTLYHFTDEANIDYIKRHGGLFSWQYLRKMNITVPYEGGGILSKSLDKRYGLEDFVRISFTENHPMMFVAHSEGRIPKPFILKINTAVCEFRDTKFANMNATRNGHKCGNSLEDLKKIKFEVVKQRTHFDLSETDRPYYQAEVLVKTWIPIEFITNINNKF